MTQHDIKLQPGHYYHIYNRGINEMRVFPKPHNKNVFLKKYVLYLSEYVDTLAYCLLDNHFHLIVRIKNSFPLLHDLGDGLHSSECVVNKQFAKLFNSYTQSYNLLTKRSGALFEKTFKRKQIEMDRYLVQSMLYVMANPVHHKVAKRSEDYRFGSYSNISSDVYDEIVDNDLVMQLFGNHENLKLGIKEFEAIEELKRFTKLEVEKNI